MCLIQQFEVATRSTSPDMATVFHVLPYGRVIEIQSNLRRKKLHRTNQNSNFLGAIEPQSNFEEKVNPSILKDDFSSRTDPFIFTSIPPVLLDRSNETSWVLSALKSTSHFLSQSTVSRRSDYIRSQFKLLSQIRCLIKLRVENSTISIDNNITDNIIRKVINVYRKSVGQRMGPWGTPALTEYSCEDFPSRTTRSRLLLRKEELRPNIWPEIP